MIRWADSSFSIYTLMKQEVDPRPVKPKLVIKAFSVLLLILLALGGSLVIGASPTDIVSGSTTLVVSPPSSVTSATNSCCISTWGPINSLYLTFYYDNSAGWFRTCSATSCVWSSPTKIQTAGTFWFSAWLSGTNVYYVSSKNSADSNFYFRSGTINSNGSITWDYVGGQWLALRGEQKIGALNNANQPCSNVRGIYVSVDDSGVVWASFQCKDASGNYFFDVYSYLSNHSWNLRHIDSNGASSFEIGYTVPLTSGKLALLYQIRIVGQQGTNPNANVITWDGAGTWSQPVTTAAVVGQTSSTHNGDTLQFCSFGQNSLLLWTYIYGSLSWNSPVTVSPSLPTGVGGYNCAVTTDGTDMIILYGPESSSTYANLSTDIGSSWTPLTPIDSGLTASQRQTLPPTFSGTFTGLWYSKQSSNSNLLRYAIFSLETTTTTSTSTSSSTTISSSTTAISSTTTNSTTSATTSAATSSTTT